MVDDGRVSDREAVDLMADAGRIMYGKHFIAGLCRLLAVNERRIRHWLAGRGEIEEKHIQRIRQMLNIYTHEESTVDLIKRFDAYLARKR